MLENHANKPTRWYEQPTVQGTPASTDAYMDSLKLKTESTGSTAHLAAIVGDPTMPESKWLAACTLAQDEPLVKSESVLKKYTAGFATLSSAFCLLATVMLCYPLSLFIGAEVMGITGAVDPNVYLSQLSGGDAAGLFIALLSFVSFLVCFLTDSKWIKALACGVSLGSIMGIAAIFGNGFFGPVGLSLAIICGLATFALNHIGTALRQALPRTFAPQQVLHSTLTLLVLPTILIAWSISIVTSGEYHSYGGYGPASVGGLFCDITGLAYCAGLGGFILARSSKSTSIKACVSLAAFFQAPLFMGLLFATAVAGCAALGLQTNSNPSDADIFRTIFDPAWKSSGALKVIGLLMSVPATALLASLGAYAGVLRNRA